MKKHHAWGLYLMLAATVLTAAENQPTVQESLPQKGPHHRVIERLTRTVLEDGTVAENRSQLMEMATGLHYRSGEEWLETRELIEPNPNGAVAPYGPNKASFAANLNTLGAINLVDESGQEFSSHILGLAYTDAASGQSVMIALVKNSFGQILPPNQMVYADAFTDVRADVRYTYVRSGFEQDIIIREALPSPANYGLDPETTRLEVFTEFVTAPAGVAQSRIISGETDPIKRAAMVLPDFVDEDLNFGALKTGEGKAVDLQGVVPHNIPVSKTFEIREGRTFLIEAVQFSTVQAALNALPEKRANAAGDQRRAKATVPSRGAVGRLFPPAPKRQAAADRQPATHMASLNTKSGLLLDYVFTMTSGVTNFTFRPEATHSVSGTINLYGTNTIHGGTIIKYARGGVISLNGSIVCETTPYHPAVFSAADDGSMGDSVTANSLTGYYATAALRASSNVVGELHDLRFAYAATGIDWKGSTDRFYNLQFINCSNAVNRIDANGASVHNILITNCLYGFLGSNSLLNAQHVTARTVGSLINLSGSPATLTLTNAILVDVTNAGTGTVTTDYLATNGTPYFASASHAYDAANCFTASVGGAHYLTTNSTLRDLGTTNIAANLLSELAQLTTYAPVLLNSTTTVSVTLSPIALRDSDLPDLGYHYAPLDYVFRAYRINTNAVLTLTNGVAVGIDYNAGSWGLIFDTATNISIGSPTSFNRIVRAHCVQERSTGNPGTRAMIYDIGDSGTHGNSEARYRFTEFAAMAADGFATYTGKNWINWEWSHSWVYNLSLSLSASKGGQTYGITNTLFQWADFTLQRSGSSSVFHLRNNLFRNHNLNIADLNSSSTMRDNLFDTQIVYTNSTTVTHSHNAFYLTTNNSSYATNALPGLNNNLPLTTLTYHTDPYGRYGPYGRYYQPTNSLVINAGSQLATAAALYHFTTTTNQVKETNSTVDIGLHYVALNGNGNPVDTDGDGLPDYWEDGNGNGSYDTGELNWQNADTDGDGVNDGLELLQGRNPLGGVLTDTNNILNLRVFTPLK